MTLDPSLFTSFLLPPHFTYLWALACAIRACPIKTTPILELSSASYGSREGQRFTFRAWRFAFRVSLFQKMGGARYTPNRVHKIFREMLPFFWKRETRDAKRQARNVKRCETRNVALLGFRSLRILGEDFPAFPPPTNLNAHAHTENTVRLVCDHRHVRVYA